MRSQDLHWPADKSAVLPALSLDVLRGISRVSETVPQVTRAMSNLLRLIYVSRATAPMELPELESLLAQARTRNAEQEITGVLCTGRGYFVQALEGQETDVLKTYARILTDKRHRDSSLLSVGLVAKRIFDQWAMAHVDGNTLGADLHSKLVSQIVLERDLSDSLKVLQGALKTLRRAT
jgi:hypothetical protein